MTARVTTLSAVVCLVGAIFARGQGQVIVPDSTVEHREDIGKKAHTNHLIFVRPDLTGASPGGEIPASLGCVYRIVSPLTSDRPIKYDNSMPNPSADRRRSLSWTHSDHPSAYTDLNRFSQEFNLPQLPQCSSTVTTSCFQKFFAAG